MKILHLSDIHYRAHYAAAGNGYERMLAKMPDPLVALGRVCDQVLAENDVALVVIAGDLCDEGSVADYRLLRTALRRHIGDLPLLVTPGNHDDKAALREGFLDEVASAAPYCAAYDSDAVSVLSFDSSAHGVSDGHLDKRALDWLAEALAERAAQPVLLLTHHHLDPKQASIPALQADDMFWQLLAKKPPLAILNGHTHHQATGRVQDIPYYTAANLSFCGEDLPDGRVRFVERIGYSLYTMHEGRIAQTKHETFASGHIIDILKGSELA